jgi:hypothetical protein
MKIEFSKIKQIASSHNDWKKIVKSIVNNNYDIDKILKSLAENLCYEDNILNDCLIEDNNYYYDSDYYYTDYYGRISHIEDLGYCEYYESYFPNEEINIINNGRNVVYYSDRAINNGREVIYTYQGEYYTERGLTDNNLVVDFNGEIGSLDDLYYWESDNEYHDEPEEDPEEEVEFLRSYHNDQNFKTVDFPKSKSKYTIGFEIEKEDQNILESISINDFEEILPLWRKERDGSLNNDGYELISPVYQFDIPSIFEDIKESKTLIDHINAGISTRCGGHINLGHKEKSGSEVFELVCGYMPLLYALYYGRVDKTYSKGKSNNDLKVENEKYQAIKIHSNRIEFRIFSGVPNIDTLKWRCELINLMLKYPTNDIKKAFYFVETRFSTILEKQYKTPEKMSVLKDRLKSFSLRFENIKL